MSEEVNKNADVELLGQKLYFPNSVLKLISFTVCISAIVFLIYCAMVHHYSVVKNKDGFSFTLIENKADLIKGYTIGFWTPSDSTRNGLSDLPKEDTAAYSWQVHCVYGNNFEEANREFGKRLKDKFDFKGYRRYKVVGEGATTHIKEGWWWSITFRGKCDEEFLKDLKDYYTKFWSPADKGKNWDKLYVEVTGNTK